MFRVVALDNAGGNIVDRLLSLGDFPDIQFVFCDTYEVDLMKHGRSTDRHVLLSNLPKCHEDLHDDNELMAVLVTGLGGECSNRFGYDVIHELWNYADRTYCFATLPTAFEGTERCRKATELFDWINQYSDITVLQDNGKLPENISINDMDYCLASLLQLALDHPKKGLSDEKDELPLGVWATQKQLMMALRAKYSNYLPLADYYEAGAISFHKQKD